MCRRCADRHGSGGADSMGQLLQKSESGHRVHRSRLLWPRRPGVRGLREFLHLPRQGRRGAEVRHPRRHHAGGPGHGAHAQRQATWFPKWRLGHLSGGAGDDRAERFRAEADQSHGSVFLHHRGHHRLLALLAGRHCEPGQGPAHHEVLLLRAQLRAAAARGWAGARRARPVEVWEVGAAAPRHPGSARPPRGPGRPARAPGRGGRRRGPADRPGAQRGPEEARRRCNVRRRTGRGCRQESSALCQMCDLADGSVFGRRRCSGGGEVHWQVHAFAPTTLL
mmetsp:Transcript_116643/g.371046  ORF Transcript_116643/g.371046 Transcript_116643/m.371046 type:complete len:280 (+) Transcript_116643:468-1307(+)